MKNVRSLKGQELVEFALILPIMLIILVAISEMGFMWTLRGTVSDAIKSSVQRMQTLAGSTRANITTNLQTSIRTYLTSHGVPNANSATIELADKAGSNYSTINVAYTYNPAFTLPNFFGIQLLPSSITMHSSQVINAALLQQNTYSGTNLPSALNLGTPTSILKNTADTNARKQMTFAIDYSGADEIDQVVNWWGHSVFPPSAGIKVETGTIWIRSPYQTAQTPNADGWEDTGESYVPTLLANGYTTLIYIDGAGNTSPSTTQLAGYGDVNSGDMGAAISSKWCKPQSAFGGAQTCDTDISGELATNNVMVDSITKMTQGYSVYPPAPATTSGIEAVGVVPTGYSVPDNVYRDVLSKFKIYTPKSVNSDAAKFTTPTLTQTDVTNLTSSPNSFLDRTSDIDGDGIPDKWDQDPTEADVDRDLTLDGYQSHTLNDGINASAANYRGNYTASTTVDGKNGYVPQNSVTDVSLTLAAMDYVTPTGDFASKACADTTGACPGKPFFLRVKNVYKNTMGQEVKAPVSTAYNADTTTEKNIGVADTNKKIYEVEVVSRDKDGDGFFEPSVCPTFGDDDFNNDCRNDKLDTNAVNSTGLMFVDMNSGTGGKSYASIAGQTFATLGYTGISLTDVTKLDQAADRLKSANKPTVTNN